MFTIVRNQNETQEAWIERVINAKTATNGVLRFACKFIEPGLVHYRKGELHPDQAITLKVTKQILDKMAQGYVGMPVVNELHNDLEPSDYKNGAPDGIVTRVWFEPVDGWYWCEFLVWDARTQRNCKSSAYAVSCAYRIEQPLGPGGEHNSVPYDGELLNGYYLHLAVVSNPRYEGSRIVALNSKGGTNMWKFFQLGKDKEGKEVRNSVEITGDSMIEVKGKQVSLKDLIAARNAKKKAAPLLGDDTVIVIDGEEIKIADLKNSYEPEDDEETKKKKEKDAMNTAHNSGTHTAHVENCEACATAKNQKDLEAKNAADAAAAAELAAKNAKGDQHFEAVKLAAENRGEAVVPQMRSLQEGIAEGKKLYGSPAA